MYFLDFNINSKYSYNDKIYITQMLIYSLLECELLRFYAPICPALAKRIGELLDLQCVCIYTLFCKTAQVCIVQPGLDKSMYSVCIILYTPRYEVKKNGLIFTGLLAHDSLLLSQRKRLSLGYLESFLIAHISFSTCTGLNPRLLVFQSSD